MTQITYVQKGVIVALGLAFGAAGAAQAAEPRRAGELQAVVDCRGVADSAARLTCYDAAAARLDEAEANGEIVVLDKAQRQQARREAFGSTISSTDPFGRGEPAEKLDRVSFKVVRAWQMVKGQWAMELDSGAIWRQIDQEHLSRPPKEGSTVEIRNAALGSYFMNIDGGRAIRVKRDR